MGASYRLNRMGGLVMNDDNDSNRRFVESCYRTQKTMVNPIVDWTDDEVWEFLNDITKVPHCCLYDEGNERIGCIGCPMASAEKRTKDFERYPRFRALYIGAFERMIEKRKATGLPDIYRDGEAVMRWWLNDRTESKKHEAD